MPVRGPDVQCLNLKVVCRRWGAPGEMLAKGKKVVGYRNGKSDAKSNAHNVRSADGGQDIPANLSIRCSSKWPFGILPSGGNTEIHLPLAPSILSVRILFFLSTSDFAFRCIGAPFLHLGIRSPADQYVSWIPHHSMGPATGRAIAKPSKSQI